MYQRRVFDHIKGFNTSLRAAEDYDLYLRIAQKFAMACHRNVVAEYRHHGDSMSSNQKLMLEQVTSVLRDQLKRIGGNTEYEEACRTGLDFFQRLLSDSDHSGKHADRCPQKGLEWNPSRYAATPMV